MQRKLFRTSFLAILMLFSLLLTSCSGEKIPVFAALITVEDIKDFYSLDDPYLITVKYGYIIRRGSEEETVGLITCCGEDEDGIQLTEKQLILEINPFYTDENYIKRKTFRIWGHYLGTSYKYKQMKTFEMPKSLFVNEKGHVEITLELVNEDEEGNKGTPWYSYSTGVHYEKRDGKIYFEKVE